MAAGGKGANQAVAAARLGGNVTMVGNLGADGFGDTAVKRLQSEGVDCSFISRDTEQASGVALISVDSEGENHIVVAPGANSTLSESHIRKALASVAEESILLLQLEVPLSCVSLAALLAESANCNVILDPAPAQQLPSELLDGLFLITPNETEAEILTRIPIECASDAEAAANKLLSMGVTNVAVTMGANGVVLANAQGHDHISAPKTTAIDTTAAGDCFNGALACALSRGDSLKNAATYACKAASIAVTRLGAQGSMPYRRELK